MPKNVSKVLGKLFRDEKYGKSKKEIWREHQGRAKAASRSKNSGGKMFPGISRKFCLTQSSLKGERVGSSTQHWRRRINPWCSDSDTVAYPEQQGPGRGAGNAGVRDVGCCVGNETFHSKDNQARALHREKRGWGQVGCHWRSQCCTKGTDADYKSSNTFLW